VQFIGSIKAEDYSHQAVAIRLSQKTAETPNAPAEMSELPDSNQASHE